MKASLFFVLPSAALALALAGCSPVAALNALAARDTYTAERDIAYGAAPRQRLDIYRPRAAAPAHGWPMVVFFYGGSWRSGDRADYTFVGEALAARGVLTVIADYRLYPEVRYPDFLDDSARALAWSLAHAATLDADPARVFVMGHSAGAYNAAMLALDDRWLRAAGHGPSELAGWIGLAGPYDFLPMGDPETQPVFFHPNYPAGSQPISHVSPRAPKAFLGAAPKDDFVDPQRNTLGLAKRLHEAGVPVTLELYPRLGHRLMIGAFARPLRGLAPVLDDVVGFVHGEPLGDAPPPHRP